VSAPITRDQLATATAELDAVPVRYDFALSPARLPAAMFGAMRATWLAFRQGAEAFTAAHGSDLRRMAAGLGLPEGFLPVWEATPADDWAIIARPDMVVHHGSPMLVDVNAGSLASLFPLNDMILRAHATAVLRPAFAIPASPRFVMGHLADIARRFLAGHDNVIAISYFAEEDDAEPNLNRWHYAAAVLELNRLGLTAVMAHVEDLDPTADGLYVSGHRVGLIYRFFLPDPGNAEHMAQLARLGPVLRSGAVHTLTSLRGEILNTKATIAVLSDERFTDRLRPSLAAALQAALPWTRLMRERHTRWRGERIDLVPWVERNRAALVLKPCLGSLGRAVAIGRETTPAAWADLIGLTLAGPESWVVQQLITPDHQPVSYFDASGVLRAEQAPAVYGTYVLDGEFSGAICRYGRHGDDRLMINGMVGAIPAPVYWSCDGT
jgi:hypothetical protein